MRINPTRQELLKLKKKLKTARAGHKLLKDKLDSLMREFLDRVHELRELRGQLEEELPSALLNFFQAQNLMGPKMIAGLFSHLPKIQLKQEEENLMGVKVERYELLNKEAVMTSPLGELAINSFLAEARERLQALFEDILKYAFLEQELRLLAEEIERTRRRVNVLEYVLIPEMVRVQKFISQKLEEGERFSRTILMKLKSQLLP